jgi:hypothetical protein
MFVVFLEIELSTEIPEQNSHDQQNNFHQAPGPVASLACC